MKNKISLKQRSEARKLALQILYQIDLCGKDILLKQESFFKEIESKAELKQYSMTLVNGIVDNIDNINLMITTNLHPLKIMNLLNNKLKISLIKLNQTYINATPLTHLNL